MNSELNYLVVKVQTDDRIRTAERARVAGAGGPDRSARRARGALASFVARRAPRSRAAGRVQPQPCVEDR
jgi:hypothetical protein